MVNAVYRGFSTAQWLRMKSFAINNLDLVKRDLLNHIFTSRGERVFMPNFGTRIPTMAFEPNDQESMDIITEDLTTVFNYDPRVNLLSLNVQSYPDNNVIIAAATLFYIEFNVTDVLNIEIPAK